MNSTSEKPTKRLREIENSNDGFYLIDNDYENSREVKKVYLRSIIGINKKD